MPPPSGNRVKINFFFWLTPFSSFSQLYGNAAQNGNGPKSDFGSISFFLKENELDEKVKNNDFIMKVRSYKWIKMD